MTSVREGFRVLVHREAFWLELCRESVAGEEVPHQKTSLRTLELDKQSVGRLPMGQSAKTVHLLRQHLFAKFDDALNQFFHGF
jgi:hypothetical protein